MRNLNKKMILPAAVSLSLFCTFPFFVGNWKQEESGQWVYSKCIVHQAQKGDFRVPELRFPIFRIYDFSTQEYPVNAKFAFTIYLLSL